MDVPDFNEDGLLPPGDYVLTLDDLKISKLVLGLEDRTRYPHWDSSWRRQLVNNAEVLIGQLVQVGITEVFLNGSFVEDKDHPNDIDGYFACDFKQLYSGDLKRALNLHDPHKCWTWDPDSRRPFRGYPKRQLPMWHYYRVELYPHYGNRSGIKDQHGNELEFPAAFRQRRGDGRAKGIIKIGGLQL